MATVFNPDGSEKVVKNLGWLLRHAAEVREITFYRSELADTDFPRPYVLTAALEDGRLFVTTWASAEVFRQWVKRPSLAHVSVIATAFGHDEEEVVA